MKTVLSLRSIETSLLCGVLLLAAGCKRQPAAESTQAPAAQPAAQTAAQPDDQQIASQIQAKIASEPALNGRQIALSVANGVATLNGQVDNEASRELAAADSASVTGVRTVVNNLTVAPQQALTSSNSRDRQARKREVKERQARNHRPDYDPDRQQDQASNTPPPPPPTPAPAQEAVQTVAPPPPPPAPVERTITVPAGTVIPVRMTDALDSATTEPNTVFHASLASDLVVDGMIVAPQGATVLGRVVDAKNAAHFSGSSLLSIELTRIETHGRQIPVVTDAYVKQGNGRGKNTAAKTGGGAALGAIIGALAGGGKGAAIGAAAGGGIGAGTNGVTRGQQVQIPSETLVNFRLQSPFTATTARSIRGDGANSTTLQQRQ